METLRQFFISNQTGQKISKKLITNYLEDKKKLFFAQKKENFLKKILLKTHQKNSKNFSLNKENQKLLGLCFFDQNQKFKLIQKHAEVFLSLLKDGYKNEYQSFIQEVLLLTQDQLSFIEKNLSPQWIERGKAEIKINEFNLSRVVNQTCVLNEGLAQSKNITIHFSSSAHNERIKSDANLLLFIFLVLLEQVLHLTQENSDLLVNLLFKEGHFVFQILDEAPLNPKEHYQNLLENKDTHLGVVYKMIRQLEGQIETHWDERKKFSLSLKLPLKISEST